MGYKPSPTYLVSTFDLQLWRSRACKRFAQSQAPCASKLARDLLAVNQLSTLVDWCAGRGIGVNFCSMANGSYDHNERLIRISSKLAPESQLHVMMHECGHHLIGAPDRNDRFGRGHLALDAASRRTNVHRVDVVDEELEAWARGLKLAKRLGLAVDVERYNHRRAKYLRNYMLWAARAYGENRSLENLPD